jgi:ABC-type multidrug transport system fused ATPase/permease subunit
VEKSLYSYIWRKTGRDQLLVIGLSVVVFPLSMVPLELQRRIINQAVGGEQIELLLSLGGAYLAVVLLQGGLKYCMNMQRGHVSECLIAELRKGISRRTIAANREGPGTADVDQQTGTTVAMVAAEVEPLGGFAGESFSVPIVQIGVLLSVVAYMIVVEPYLALAGLAVFVPQAIVIPLVQAVINRRNKRRVELIRDVGDTIVETAGDDGRPFSAHEDTSGLKRKIGLIYGLRMQVYKLKFGLKFFRNLVNHMSEIIVLLAGGWLVIEGETELGTIVAFLSGLQRVRDPWRDLVTYFRQASDARVKYELVRAATA